VSKPLPSRPPILRGAGLLLRSGPRRGYATRALAGQIVFAVATFAAAVLVARLFGPEGKGTLTTWTLVSGLGGLLLAGSVPTGFARGFLEGRPGRLGRSALRHGGLSFVALLAVGAAGIAIGLDPLAVACFLGVGVPAAVVVEDVAAVMVAAKRPWAFAAPRTLRSLILAAGLGVAAIVGGSLDVAFLLWAGGSLAAMLLALRFSRSLPTGPPMPLRRALSEGRGSATTRISTWSIRRLDQFIVAALLGLPALGIYNAAVNISEVTEYAASAIGQASFETERTLDDAAARRIIRVSAALLAVIAFVVTVAGFFLIAPVFGEEFAEARWVLVLLAPGLIFRGPAIAGGQMMLARGQGPALSRIMLGAVATGSILWTAGALAWGIEGAALASSGVYVLQALLIHRGLLRGGDDRES
jgi:O-antigen/teichoic acid export membrane protein